MISPRPARALRLERQCVTMKVNATKKSGAVNLALTGLMGALVIVGTFISIPIPVLGDRTMIGLGNVFCILSGLLLGPVYGGAAAGIGSGVYDLIGGWASSAPRRAAAGRTNHREPARRPEGMSRGAPSGSRRASTSSPQVE